jgi:hypothetical protein
MLAPDVAAQVELERPGQRAIADHLVVQQVMETDQPFRSAGGDQGAMEDAVQTLPVGAHAARLVVALRAIGEAPLHRDHVGLPVGVAEADRVTQGVGVDQDPRARDVEQCGARDRCGAEAALFVELDQVFRDEPRQRFAHRTGTDAIVARKLHDRQLRAGQMASGDEIILQRACHRGGKALETGRPVEGKLLPRAVPVFPVGNVRRAHACPQNQRASALPVHESRNGAVSCSVPFRCSTQLCGFYSPSRRMTVRHQMFWR